MSNIAENFDFIARGGFLMWPLVVLSIYTATVVIMKIIQFRKLKALKTGYVDTAVSLVKSGNSEKAIELLHISKGPVARVSEATIRLIRDDHLSRALKESEIERVGAQEIKHMESHLRALEMVSNVAPLIGLLGTVMGMIASFAQIAEAGSRVDPSMLAGGIWEALITTVGGLMVAIPALAAYYIIDNYIDKVRNAMKDAAVRFLVLESYIRPAAPLEEVAPQEAVIVEAVLQEAG